MKDSLYKKSDFLWSGLVALITLAVYVWTAAPNVTLQDSGEFLTAAQHFGVPHPTGYPLWTFLAWLFHFLPFGNAAWLINVFSGVCGALTVGCACLLSLSFQRWILGDSGPWNIVATVTSGLLLAFSTSLWSQATITEVYTLHALIVILYFMALYGWVRRPASKSLLLLTFFLLTLAFGHHQLSVTLAPLPFLCVLLLRRRMLADLIMAAVLCTLLIYLGFAILSEDPLVLKTAIRFFYLVAACLGLFVWFRRGRIRWWLIAFLPVAVILGLLQYAYLPIASSTNPPMNWGYAREAQGFYYSFNRSQYSGSLSQQSLDSLGKLMGVTTGATTVSDSPPIPTHGRSHLTIAQEFVSFYWLQLSRSFTPLSVLFYFASILVVLRLPLASRTWVYTLHIAFVLAAFLEPIKDGYGVDVSTWWLQMPWHAYAYVIFALICALGAAACLKWLANRAPRLKWLSFGLLVLPFFTFNANYDTCSQRDRWFGWMYGYDMLKDLPRDAVVIGGSDPGRFVPTYMIFGESFQPPSVQKEPFDRRDLYIITQNALGESNYMKYLRDQYAPGRPEAKGSFEKWLGRDTMYPKDPLVFPTEEETNEILKKVSEEISKDPQRQDDKTAMFSAVLKWLWEKNKDRHTFFIEESFPLEWTYDYAIPHGLVYQLGNTKMDKLPPEMVEKDFAFWKDYKARLLNDPQYLKDYDAQRSFSKLRMTMGNIYKYKKMAPEAERAYREALELWPENPEALVALTPYLWDKGEFDTVIALFDQALLKDYLNIDLWRLRIVAENRKKTDGEIRALQEQLARQPKSREIITKLVTAYAQAGEKEKAQELLERTLKESPEDADMLRLAIQFYEQNNELLLTLAPAQKLSEIESGNPQNFMLLARAYFLHNDKPKFYEAARKAIELGGVPIRETLLNEPLFAPWKADPEFKALETPSTPVNPTLAPIPIPPQPTSSPVGGQEPNTPTP